MERINYKEGDKIGFCTFLKDTESKKVTGKKKRRYAFFRCHCGNTFESVIDAVKREGILSCGCARKLEKPTRWKFFDRSMISEHRSYGDMLSRCYNPKNKRYDRYGGRGIIVCERWLDSVNDFMLDMGPKPTPKHTLERNDVDGNYEPSNCRWATIKEQLRNTSRTVWLEYEGERKPMVDWAEQLGVDQSHIRYWLKKGMCFLDVFEKLKSGNYKRKVA